ncbi:MAG: PKD domain-containing protein [Planctomycetota bacterium]|nr:PKD domain-containing protein [Planctomycetota bacterium]
MILGDDEDETWIVGIRGMAIYLNGDGCLIPMRPLGPHLSKQASLSVWVNTTCGGDGEDGSEEDPVITGIWSNVQPDVSALWGWIHHGQIGIMLGDDSPPAMSASRINDGVWHHVAFTCDDVAQEIKTYVDGKLEAKSACNEFPALAGDFLIGSVLGDNRTQFKGALDELRIYDGVLSDAEVAELAQRPVISGVPTDLAVENVGLRELDLVWSDSCALATDYSVERSIAGPDGPFVFVYRVGRPSTGNTVHYQNSGLELATSYCYRVRAVTPIGNSEPSNVAQATTLGLLPGTGTGLAATYYSGIDFSGSQLFRIDPTIEFRWGLSTPDPSIQSNSYSVAWVGQLQARSSEPYTFSLNTRGGVRLYVDGRLVIEKWRDPGTWGEYLSSNPITLETSRKYDIRLEYFNDSDDSGVRLYWNSVGTGYQIIPSSQLYVPSQPAVSIDGLPDILTQEEGSSLPLTARAFGFGPFSYGWTITRAGQPYAIGSGASYVFTPDDAGNYSISVTAADALGHSTTVSVAMLVSDVLPLIKLTGDPIVLIDTPYMLNLSAADPGKDTISFWTIDWGDGNTEVVPGNPPTATHTYRSVGEHTINALVTDEHGIHDVSKTSRYLPSSTEATWTAAEAEAVAKGGYLLSINEQDEQDLIVREFLSGKPEGFWIGLTNTDKYSGDGSYVWSSGEPVEYTNWEPGEPNNSGHQGVINPYHSPVGTPGFDTWQDANEHYYNYRGIIEIPYRPFTVRVDGARISGVPVYSPEGSPITLTGSCSGTAPVDYAWAVTRADAPYTTGSGSTFIFTPDDNGDYLVTLRVTDATGLTGSATATVRVTNVAPTLSVTGSPLAKEGASYELKLSATDPGADTISSWTINWGDGTKETLEAPISSATHTYTSSGTHGIFVAATDEDGTYGSAWSSVYELTGSIEFWSEAETEAVAKGGHLVAINDQEEQDLLIRQILDDRTDAFWIGLTNLPSYSGDRSFVWTTGQTLDYTNWNVGEPNNFMGDEHYVAMNVQQLTGPNPDAATWSDVGPYLFYGIIELAAVPRLSVRVGIARTTISGVPVASPEGSPITLTGSCSGTAPIDYAWAVTRSDAPYATGSGSTFSFTPDDDGAYPVTLRATDATGLTGSATATVRVANVAPTLSVTGAPLAEEGASYELKLAATDPAADTIASWTINWGDGTKETIEAPISSATHTYALSGTYGIFVAATDEDGTYGSAWSSVYELTGSIELWSEAEAEAVAKGGHLVAINDQQEHDLLIRQFLHLQGPNDAFWIGLTDSDEYSTEGNFVWTTEEPVDYTNWHLGEPNNSGGDEDYAVMNFHNWLFRDPALGTWNDASQSQYTYRGIIELPAPPLLTVKVIQGVEAMITGAPASSAEGTPVMLKGYAAGFDDLAFAWSVAKDGRHYASGNGSDFAFTPDDNGVYVVTLVASDSTGRQASDHATVAVTNVTPTIELVGASTAREDASYELTLKATDPGADTIRLWTVNWGDGITQAVDGTTSILTHNYTRGSYTVLVAAEDEDGVYGNIGGEAEPVLRLSVVGSGPVALPVRLDANAGTYSITEGKHLSTLSISPGVSVIVKSGCDVLMADDLVLHDGGTLDLGGSVLILRHGDSDHGQAKTAVITALVRSSLQRAWQAPGLTSSLARSGGTGLRAIAVFNNDDSTGQPIIHEFAGQVVDQNCILAKCTYNGDANLDGIVNADDYFLIDSGFISQKSGWYNGDFNYDGVINADDYFLIDLAFTRQTGPLSARTTVEAATAPGGEQLPVRAQPRKDVQATLLAELFSTQQIL